MRKIGLISAAAIIAFSLNTFDLSASIAQTAQNQATLAQALRIYGLDANNHNGFRYANKQATPTTVIFNDVHFGSAMAAQTLKIEKMPDTGNFLISFGKIDVSNDGIILKADNLTILDESLITQSRRSFRNLFSFSETENEIEGDILLQNASVESVEESMTFEIGEFKIDNLRENEGVYSFESTQMSNFKTNYKNLEFKLGQFELSGMGQDFFKLLAKLSDESKKPANENAADTKDEDFDFKQLAAISFGKLRFQNFTISPTSSMNRTRSGAQNAFIGFKLSDFEISNFNSRNIQRIALLGIEAKAVIANEDALIKLDEFSIHDFDNAMMSKVFNNVLAKEENTTPAEDGNLQTLFNRGPLSSIFSAARFGGFEINAGGGMVKLDDLSYRETRNAAGIITNTIVPPGQLNVIVNDERKPLGAFLSGFLDSFGLQELKLTWQVNASFDPNIDRVTYSNNKLELANMFGFSFDGVFDNIWSSMANVKISDFFKDNMTFSEMLRKKDSDTTSSQNNRNRSEELKKIVAESMRLFNGTKLVNANFVVSDLGGLRRISTSLAASQGKSPQEIRNSWRRNLMQDLGNKSQSSLVISVSLAAANWIQNGGQIHFNINPTAPVAIENYFQANSNSQTLGIRVENRAN